MIRKYTYGHPVKTDATVVPLTPSSDMPTPFAVCEGESGVTFTYEMQKEDAVFGLGEQLRGMNKRGWIYESWNYDDPSITEGRSCLYAAHNFILIFGEKTFGAFFDCGGKVTFDIGFTDPDLLTVTARDVDVYLIEGESALDVVKKFRTLIGPSYIPPKWAFGYAQSKWGYKCEEDIRTVYEGYRDSGIPLDMVYLDIDYMQDYKDFTVNKERYPDLPALSAELKADGVYLVPIIDAAVKVQEGYSVYDEGVEKGYFCTDGEGQPFIVGVWPGDSVLPDVLNPEARLWFGSQYKALLDQGIEGFWNDMNEPATFYSKTRLTQAVEEVAKAVGKNLQVEEYNELLGNFYKLANNTGDHASFYHNAEDGRHVHTDVHNLYGYYMTRGAAEYFEEYAPDRRFLLFSRSSYIGLHRYAGIWTGDNCSWWSHLKHNIAMMPNLDMCGFLYAGADLGGHGDRTTEELMLRWLAFGIFEPLLRNHATQGTREQEFYVFKDREAFRNLLGIRYAILPYLYSEFVRCALGGAMLSRPLCFDYPADRRARTVEDQLLIGDSVMIAPVIEQNARGRYVYLPERMKLIRMKAGDRYTERVVEKGEYYIEVPLDEIVFFLREGKVMPLAKPAKNVASLDEEHLTWLKFISEPTTFKLCRDDGFSKSSLENIETVTVEP